MLVNPKSKNIAIAYTVKRKAQNKAKGGEIHEDKSLPMASMDKMYDKQDMPMQMSKGGLAEAIMRKRGHKPIPTEYAEGGDVVLKEEYGPTIESALPHKDDSEQMLDKKKQSLSNYFAAHDHEYAEGGPVDEMGLQDQEEDADQFLSEFDDEEMEDDKKGRLRRIMADIHAKHYGK